MPFLLPFLPVIAGVGAGVGGALASKKKTTATSSSTSTTTPVESEAYNPLQSQLMKYYEGLMSQPSGLPAGYEAGGLANINKAYGLGSQNLSNVLTSRGLGTSPVAGAAEANLETGRLGNISTFQNALPMLEKQLRTGDVAAATDFFNARRTGSTTTGTGESTTTQSVNPWGAGLSSAAGMLGYLYGAGALGGGGGGGGGSQLGNTSAWSTPGFDPMGGTKAADPYLSLINWLPTIFGRSGG